MTNWGHLHSTCKLVQRASYLVLYSSLFGPDGAVNYDYIVANSINCLLIGSRCIHNGTLTIVEPIWPMLQNISKTLTCSVSAHLKQKKNYLNITNQNYEYMTKQCNLLFQAPIYTSLINNIIQDLVVAFCFQHVILIIGASPL